MESLQDILLSFSLNKDYGFRSEGTEQDPLNRVLQKTGTDIQSNPHDLEICSRTKAGSFQSGYGTESNLQSKLGNRTRGLEKDQFCGFVLHL